MWQKPENLRKRGAPPQMATGKTNKFREDLCSLLEGKNKKTLCIKTFKHVNHTFLKKRTVFHK